ncbi:MAG: DNA polymerase/3'-5' exonuclease PolX [Acidobacteriaceae bacterium]
MDNRSIAQMLEETADLLEIDGGDSFRIRSYRRAAEAIAGTTVALSEIAQDAKQLQAIPGIGKGMAANIAAMEETGTFSPRRELLEKYGAGILELLKLPGMGPKTVALLFSSLAIKTVEDLEAALKAGKLEGVPRFGAKHIENLKKGIEEYHQHTGRFLLNVADREAEAFREYLGGLEGLEQIAVAGSYRRGRETVGDLDVLISGPACEQDRATETAKYVAAYPGIADILAHGQNKVSFQLRNRMQVDVRLLPESSYGAALQYFTGSKSHNVTLRQRALKQGYTLSEYALARVKDGSVVAARTEEEIYAALGLDWIPPHLRENLGEIEAAEKHTLPKLVELEDIRGDVHAHTTATDGRCSIKEMAEAALERGYEYMAITDHSKNLAMTNGLDAKRALAHMKKIREVDEEMEGRIRVLTGIEVDILGDGELDLPDDVLAEMDIVIASVHTLFNQPRKEMTERVLRAVENPYVRVLGHPTGRLLLRREPFDFDLGAVLERCAELGVAVEQNSSPERLDLNDVNLRMAREKGCKIVINTDAHHTSQYGNIQYGMRQLRRAWLAKKDVLNTLPAKKFLGALRPRP